MPADQIEAARVSIAAKMPMRGHILRGPIFIEWAEAVDMPELRLLKVSYPWAYNAVGRNGALQVFFAGRVGEGMVQVNVRIPMNAVAGHRPVRIDRGSDRTYYVYVNLTLSVDEEIVAKARARAEKLGTSVNQLVRDYLEQLAGQRDPKAVAEEFVRLSMESTGNSAGWKYKREDAYDRR